MTMKKIVLRVCIMCRRCKVCIMVTIAKFGGIVSMALDAEKSTVTIVGDVDATLIVQALRKAKKGVVEIVSVGEPDKKKEPEPSKALPPCCSSCRSVVVLYDQQPNAYCAIM